MSHAALSHTVNGFFDAFRSSPAAPQVAAQPASRAARVTVDSRWNEGDDESLLESATSLPRPTLKALEKAIRADGFKGALVSGWSQGQRGGFTVSYGGQRYEFEISENVTPRPVGEIGRLVKESGRYSPNAQWTRAYIDELPDSAFLYVDHAACSSRDREGRSHPLHCRHFPYRDSSGKVDLHHLRNALSRIPQSNVSEHAQREATRKAERLLAQHGGYERNSRRWGSQGESEDDYVLGVVDRDANIGLFRVGRSGLIGPLETSADIDVITRAMEADVRELGVHAAAVFEMRDDGRYTQVGNVVNGRYQESGDYQGNGRGTVADPHAVDELELYITNTYELVGDPNSIGKSIDANLRRKLASGKYDPALAPKAWQHLVDAGAKRYAKEIGPEPTFNAATRRQLAAGMARAWEEENQLARNSSMNEQQQQFIDEVQRTFDPVANDRQLFFRTGWADGLHITYVNLPKGVGGAGGGAEAQNNRMDFDVTWFAGRAKIEQSSTFDRSRRLRGKTGAPVAIARYLADYLVGFAAAVPPNFTHSR